MNIWLLEPYYTGSHKVWADQYIDHSSHKITIFHLEGRHWKWRMQGAALTLAGQCNSHYQETQVKPEWFFISDMINVAVFKGLLCHDLQAVPIFLYFHENQLSYPYQDQDTDSRHARDFHYGFMNFQSILAADKVAFNSASQKDAFYRDITHLLKRMPDHRCQLELESARSKTFVLPLGLETSVLNERRPLMSAQDLVAREDLKGPASKGPLLLWSHRWEHDKNPDLFFKGLETLSAEGLDFQVAILGARSKRYPEVFDRVKETLGDHILAWGKPQSYEAYVDWLWLADLIPVTSYHETFGLSVLEAAYCHTDLLLPDRLSYPELYDPQANKDWFYKKDGDFIPALRRAIGSHGSEGQKKRKASAHERAKAYDWLHTVHLYDAVFLDRSL